MIAVEFLTVRRYAGHPGWTLWRHPSTHVWAATIDCRDGAPVWPALTDCSRTRSGAIQHVRERITAFVLAELRGEPEPWMPHRHRGNLTGALALTEAK